MEYATVGDSDLRVSRLCLGAMNFGTPGWGCDKSVAADLVSAFRDAGGTFFDTADVYGGGASEQILGQLLRECRSEVVLASKVGMPTLSGDRGASPNHVRASVEGSLRRLGTDYLDLYQLHYYDSTVPLEQTLSTLDDLVQAGLVRYVGCSNYFAWQVAHAHDTSLVQGLAPIISVQMMYNLVRRDIEREHVACTQRLGVGLIAYGPLHGGLLAGGWGSRAELPADSRPATHPDVYFADEDRTFAISRTLRAVAKRLGESPGRVALAWTLHNRALCSVLTSAQTVQELKDQLPATQLDLDPESLSVLDAASALPPAYPGDFYERLGTR